MIRRPIYRGMTVSPAARVIEQAKLTIARTCSVCRGARIVRMQLPGRPETARDFKCETCKGEGEVLENV